MKSNMDVTENPPRMKEQNEKQVLRTETVSKFGSVQSAALFLRERLLTYSVLHFLIKV